MTGFTGSTNGSHSNKALPVNKDGGHFLQPSSLNRKSKKPSLLLYPQTGTPFPASLTAH